MDRRSGIGVGRPGLWFREGRYCDYVIFNLLIFLITIFCVYNLYNLIYLDCHSLSLDTFVLVWQSTLSFCSWQIPKYFQIWKDFSYIIQTHNLFKLCKWRYVKLTYLVLLMSNFACCDFSWVFCIMWLMLSHKNPIPCSYKTTYFSVCLFLFTFSPFSPIDIETSPVLPFWSLDTDPDHRKLWSPDAAVSFLHQSYGITTLDVPVRPWVGLLLFFREATPNRFQCSLGLCSQEALHEIKNGR